MTDATSFKQGLARRRLLALPLLAGCAARPRVSDDFPAPASGVPEPLDLAQSALRILVFRGGAAARLGHNHVLRAGDLTGELVWPDAPTQAARRWREASLNLSFSLSALLIDPPAERAALGPAFASELGERDREGTRANLLKALDAEGYPKVRLQTTRIVGEGPRLAVEVAILLHGRVRHQWLAVTVEGPQATGQTVIRHSDFGLQPFSVLGGLLAVRDELVVDFSLAAAEP